MHVGAGYREITVAKQLMEMMMMMNGHADDDDDDGGPSGCSLGEIGICLSQGAHNF